MIIFVYGLSFVAASLLLIMAIAFFRAKDLYAMIHFVLIANLYVIPLLLLAVGLEKFSLISFVKIVAIVVLNIVGTHLLCDVIARRAMINKILPDADFSKKLGK